MRTDYFLVRTQMMFSFLEQQKVDEGSPVETIRDKWPE